MVVDELEALIAIFGPENVTSSHEGKRIEIRGLEASLQTGMDTMFTGNIDATFSLVIELPEEGYPATNAPSLTINAHWLTPVEAQKLAHTTIHEIWLADNSQDDLLTSIVLHLCNNIPTQKVLSTNVWKVQPVSCPKTQYPTPQVENWDRIKPNSVTVTSGNYAIEIKHGRVLIDRKSSFQAHYANVKSKAEVDAVLDTLLSINKISRATHNIWSYSIPSAVCGKSMDHDSDGESGAGRKLHAMLDLLGANNTFVMVSRWYGGIKLGPDRFRHINTVAAEMIRENS